jgi:hypothetical protein
MKKTPWHSSSSIFIYTLVNKKYSLPISVVEILVGHFAAFASDDRELPLTWHRALLVFLQRYKVKFLCIDFVHVLVFLQRYKVKFMCIDFVHVLVFLQRYKVKFLCIDFVDVASTGPYPA